MIDLKERHDPAAQPVSLRMQIFSVFSISLPWGQAHLQTSWVSTLVGPKIPNDAKMATATHDIYFYIYHSGEEKVSSDSTHRGGKEFHFLIITGKQLFCLFGSDSAKYFPTVAKRWDFFFFFFSSRKLIILDLGVGSILPISHCGEGWGWSPKRQIWVVLLEALELCFPGL